MDFVSPVISQVNTALNPKKTENSNQDDLPTFQSPGVASDVREDNPEVLVAVPESSITTQPMNSTTTQASIVTQAPTAISTNEAVPKAAN